MKNFQLEEHQEAKLPRSQTQSKLVPGYSKVIHCSKPKYSSETFNMKNQSSKNISLLLDTFSLFSHKGKKSNTTPTKINHPQIPSANPTSEFTLSPSSTKSINNNNSNSNSNNSSTSTFYSSITQSVQEPIKIIKTFQPVSFEELILIEEKIINIVSSIKNKKPYVINECIEWWNCFVVSCFYTGVMGPIKDPEVKVLIKNACSLLMYSILLTYYSILLKSINAKNYDEKLLDMILYHHRIFLLMCKYLIVNLVNSSSTKEEISIITKLSKQISLYIKHNPSSDTTVSTLIVNELRLYCNCLSELIGKLVKKFSSLNSLANSNSSELFLIFQNLKQKSLNDLNDYFIENYLRNKTKQTTNNNNNSNNGSTTFSSIEVSVPYLKTKNIKKFTLVLDLDETLIHFHYDIKKDPQITHGIIQYRPGLFEFLQNVAPYFELIIFTVATRQYADPVINTIESKQKFFTCRLYREHTTIYQNDFVKDLKNLGRDLSKVIIIDDKPFNFCLQKENGIAIRPYWGTDNENKNDVALINLIPILFDIMKDKSSDVRLGIKRYKNEIVNKVSSYIYQSKMFN